MERVLALIFYVLSFLLGSLLTLMLVYWKTHGVLVIDDSGEKAVWSFVVEKPLDDFEKRKMVIFRVKKKSR